jgi:ribosomal protein L13E
MAGSDSSEPFGEDEHPIFATSRITKMIMAGAELQRETQRLGIEICMSSWQKSDWRQFYEIARRPWRRHRPPRPVYPSGLNRVAPAQGFSLSELDDAGVDLDLAETLGLPVDAGRIGVYGPNVSVLRDFIRSSRPL